MALKIHGIPMSTCTARVLTCLHEKGLEFELAPVNLSVGEHKQTPFLSKNPFGQIPVLEDGDLTLFESRAITMYVSKKYKEKGEDLLRLKGDDLKEQAMVGVWVEVESQQYSPAITPIISEYFLAPMHGKTPDEKVIEAGVEKFGKVLDVYETRLCQSKYLAGDFYSLADLHHLSYTHYFMKTPWASLINSRPHVKAWWDNISSRSAFQKVSQAMTFGDKK
ncbi:glutathione S-transferase F13-like [Telopea speciosissima]|uniref:glutathione S-transferase F13-like n=1 Tax=Telopea speciosissima TaxID=54955 RepID=UPI001CC754B1|nr:glutathione S-transferase F13-like [Telopea speciosissima]